MKRYQKIIGSILVLVIIFAAGWESASYYILVRGGKNQVKQEDASPLAALTSLMSSEDDRADLGLFWRVWDTLDELYVQEEALDKQQMVYGAIKGMVSALDDPYTVFMTPNETKEFDQNLHGTLLGIGAELSVKDQLLVVVSPLKNSPAEKAGLLPGDVVYKIDGNLTSDMTLFDAISKIRGEKGTKVTLTIVRKGKEQPFDVSIVRDEVNIESVTLEEKEDGIYNIIVNQFSDNTMVEFDKIVQKLLLKDPKGIIIDLRYNGGGYLDIAVDMLSELVKGKVPAVTIKKRDEKENKTLNTSGNPVLGDVPLVVLINKGSASASEIVAGAIQDHKRGLIFGEQSFGKGSVQEVDKMPDGSSLRITIAQWFTPNGKNVSEVGITPDRVIPLTEEDFNAKKDPQLDEAVKYLLSLQK